MKIDASSFAGGFVKAATEAGLDQKQILELLKSADQFSPDYLEMLGDAGNPAAPLSGDTAGQLARTAAREANFAGHMAPVSSAMEAAAPQAGRLAKMMSMLKGMPRGGKLGLAGAAALPLGWGLGHLAGKATDISPEQLAADRANTLAGAAADKEEIFTNALKANPMGVAMQHPMHALQTGWGMLPEWGKWGVGAAGAGIPTALLLNHMFNRPKKREE